MSPEHERVIEAMVGAAVDTRDDGLDYADAIRDALRAAAERGYVLAKLPEREKDPAPAITLNTEEDCYDDHYAGAWNDCLDAIETITLEEQA